MSTALAPRAQRLDDIRLMPDAAIDEDLRLAVDGLGDLGQAEESGIGAIQLTSAMVGNGDGVDSHRDQAVGILRTGNALDDQLALPEIADRLEIVPCERGVVVAADGRGDLVEAARRC